MTALSQPVVAREQVADDEGQARIALVLCYLGEGGIERNRLRLAEALIRRGFAVDLLVGSTRDESLHEVPSGVGVKLLQRAKMGLSLRLLVAALEPLTIRRLLIPRLNRLPRIRFRNKGALGNATLIPALADYLRQAKPAGIIAAEPSFGVPVIWARRLAGTDSKVMISEHNAPLRHVQDFWLDPKFRRIAVAAYQHADAIVAVSRGIAADLAGFGIPEHKLHVIYNPVVSDTLRQQADAPSPHSWLAHPTRPVVLGVGRMHAQKDFATLVRAFARVRRSVPARLILVGGTGGHPGGIACLQSLRELTNELGVSDEVAFVGYQRNPYAFMRRASVFVLSSVHEGLPTVLIEAMACGCPVVSTDCPHGPREILDHGRYGRLVGVGDVEAMASAITATLEHPPPPEALLRRASKFSVEAAVAAYLDLLALPHAGVASAGPSLNALP